MVAERAGKLRLQITGHLLFGRRLSFRFATTHSSQVCPCERKKEKGGLDKDGVQWRHKVTLQRYFKVRRLTLARLPLIPRWAWNASPRIEIALTIRFLYRASKCICRRTTTVMRYLKRVSPCLPMESATAAGCGGNTSCCCNRLRMIGRGRWHFGVNYWRVDPSVKSIGWDKINRDYRLFPRDHVRRRKFGLRQW